MSSVLIELRRTLRRLAREPGFSGAAVATLAVGIGLAASVFALVEGVLLRPLPYPDAERLVAVRHVAPGIEFTRDGVSPGVFLHYRDGNRTFEAIATYHTSSGALTGGERSERVRTAMVTPELFEVLRVGPRIGRLPTALDHEVDYEADAGTVGALLSHDLWVSRFGADPTVIGRTIELDGNPLVVVTGVAEEGFHFPDPETAMWLVVPHEDTPWISSARVRNGMSLDVIGRLRPEGTLGDAETDLNRLVGRLPEAFADVTSADLDETGLRATVVPYKDVVVGEVRLALLLVLASGAFLLLVTWANVANLMLLRTHRRRVEIGIARALGASERHVAGAVVSESLVLCAAGAALGLGLARVAIDARFGFAAHQLPRLDGVGVNATVVALVVALALVSGTLMAAICLAGTRHRVAGATLATLGTRSAAGERGGQRGRKVLVAAQMAMAMTLLVGSGLMARTYAHLQRVELGFRSQGAFTFSLPANQLGLEPDYHAYAQVYERVFHRLREVPGVDAVESASEGAFPLTVPEFLDVQRIAPAATSERRTEDWPLAASAYATPGYFHAMGIPLLSGRPFRMEDTSLEAPGVIVSRSLAQDLFSGRDPIGQVVEFADFPSWASFTIVGVVGDVPGTTMRVPDARAIYLPLMHPAAADVITGNLHHFLPLSDVVVLRTEREAALLLPELRRAVEEVDPRLVILDFAPLDDIVAEATAQERITLRILLVSAASALFLGVVGIYGVLAYSVRLRTAEIGVRAALGASPARVRRLVVLQGVLLSGAGVVVGLVTALLLTRFMAALLYATSPTDPATFTIVTLLLLGVAFAASYVPATRASRVDPARALRAE
jgi:predicted permease